MKATTICFFFFYLALLGHTEAWRRLAIKINILNEDLDTILGVFKRSSSEQMGFIRFGKALGFKLFYKESIVEPPSEWSPEDTLRIRCYSTMDKIPLKGGLFYKDGQSVINGSFVQLSEGATVSVPVCADFTGAQPLRPRVPTTAEIPYVKFNEFKQQLHGRWNKMRNGRSILKEDYFGHHDRYNNVLSFYVKLTYDQGKDKIQIGDSLKGLFGTEVDRDMLLDRSQLFRNVEYDGNTNVLTSDGVEITDVVYIRLLGKTN